MLKNNKKFLFYLTCTVIWMGIIFAFSAQPADMSNQTSLGFGRKIAEIIVPGFKEMLAAEQENLLENWNFAIRKTAHFCEYAVLGIWCALTLMQTKIKTSYILATVTLVCMLAASGDEFHQLFVGGRAGRIQDVCIDTAGACTGVIGLLLKSKFTKKIQRKF